MKYRYSGVKLPGLPEYDETVYSSAVIIRFLDGSGYGLICANRPFVALKTDVYDNIYNRVYTIALDPEAEVISFVCAPKDKAWKEADSRFEPSPDAILTYISPTVARYLWTKENILYSDSTGTAYWGSEPVPVPDWRRNFLTGLALGLTGKPLPLSTDTPEPPADQEPPGSTAAPELPTLAAGHSWFKGPSTGKVKSITFLDYDPPGQYDEKWDASAAEDGSITGYLSGADVYIVGNGSGKMKANSEGLWFGVFTFVEQIHGMHLIDTGELTSMSGMFLNCRYLLSLDLSGFDTGKVTDMGDMFGNCFALKSLDVSGFDTRNVTDMVQMFTNCWVLEALDISSFQTGNVTIMQIMFGNCKAMKSIYVGDGWSLNSAGTAYGLFSGCSVSKLTYKASGGGTAANRFRGWIVGKRLAAMRGKEQEAGNTARLGLAALGRMLLGKE